MEKISFTPLQEHHFPMLCQWLNRPHLRAHYQKDPTDLLEVTGRFTSQILGLVDIEAFLSHLNFGGPAVGLVQRTKLLHQPQSWPPLGLDPTSRHCQESWSIDHFLCDPSHFGQGGIVLGEFVAQFPASYLIVHAHDNPRAIGASRKAGFCVEDVFDFKGQTHIRLVSDTSPKNQTPA